MIAPLVVPGKTLNPGTFAAEANPAATFTTASTCVGISVCVTPSGNAKRPVTTKLPGAVAGLLAEKLFNAHVKAT